MKAADSRDLWTQLLARGLVKGSIPDSSETESPWYMRGMAATSGSIAALFILTALFMALSRVLEDNGGRIVIGLILESSALFLFRSPQANGFRAQFALALSGAAQILLIWSLWSILEKNPTLLTLAIICLELGLLFLVRNSIHHLASAFLAGGALFLLLNQYHLNSLGAPLLLGTACWLWLNEIQRPERIQVLQPLAWGLTLVALLALNWSEFNLWLRLLPQGHGDQHPLIVSLRILLTIGISAGVLVRLYKEAGVGPLSLFGLAALILLSLLSVIIPGVGFSLLLMLVAFARGNRVLLFTGLAALLYHLSRYYYVLDLSLLHKSLLLMSCGLLLLGLHWWLRSTWTEARTNS